MQKLTGKFIVKDGIATGSNRTRGSHSIDIDDSLGLTWSDNDTPVSIRFDDCYYSKNDGRKETQTVFIAGNQLPDAWASRNNFVIGELGFGTGLNFAETVNNWRRQAPGQAELNYITFERFPLSRKQMERALVRWPDLLKLMEPFLFNWPPAPGCSQISHQDINLTLFIGDATQQIESVYPEIDCWFLDGFSPAKNPELWEEDLLKQVFEKTRVGGTFSTFTSAGWVRRNLENAGFKVQKLKGFDRKRARLQGYKPISD